MKKELSSGAELVRGREVGTEQGEGRPSAGPVEAGVLVQIR